MDEIRGLYAYMVLWSSYTSLSCFMHPLTKGKDYLQGASWFKHVLLLLRDITGNMCEGFSEEEE